MARFSLLLTNVVSTTVIPAHVQQWRDVETSDGGNFTDGCGSISPHLANKLYQQSKEVLGRRSDRAVREPSVFQIRHQGNKGIVTRDSTLPSDTMIVRDSMVKFQTKEFPHVCVCDFSGPFSYGHLNRQFIMLLSGLGIPDQVFESLQAEHFDRIRKMTTCRDSALMILEWRHRTCELLDAYEEEGAHDFHQDGLPLPLKDLKEVQQRLIRESAKSRSWCQSLGLFLA